MATVTSQACWNLADGSDQRSAMVVVIKKKY
jgi:hypothetical protein